MSAHMDSSLPRCPTPRLPHANMVQISWPPPPLPPVEPIPSRHWRCECGKAYVAVSVLDSIGAHGEWRRAPSLDGGQEGWFSA